MSRRAAGLWAENAALSYLVAKGYKPLWQNWTCRWGEIDLIVQKDRTLVFVEVKYRSTDSHGAPEEAVNYFKRIKLQRSIRIFLAKYPYLSTKWRIDVISVRKQRVHGESATKVTFMHYDSIPII